MGDGQAAEVGAADNSRVRGAEAAGTQAGRLKEMTARYEAWMKRCHVEPWETVRPRR